MTKDIITEIRNDLRDLKQEFSILQELLNNLKNNSSNNHSIDSYNDNDFRNEMNKMTTELKTIKQKLILKGI